MATPQPARPAGGNALPWTLIVLGTLAVLLAVWDLLIERDGGGGSLAALAVGALVAGLGVRSLSRGRSRP